MAEVAVHDPILAGLYVPPKLGPGKPRQEALEPWLELVAQLMSRGVNTPSKLRRLLGVHFRTAKNWMAIVHERWALGLSDDLVNIRRESLYNEADEVARAAWTTAMSAETPSEKASLYKVMLMANARKAALTGLDTLEVRVNKRVETHTTVQLVQRVETEHGLAPGALEALGRSAARLLSAPQLDPTALLSDQSAAPVAVNVIDADGVG